MNTTNLIELIIYIIVILLIGLLIGWLLAKWKFKNHIKKIDKKLNDPKEIKRILNLKKEQEEVDERREKEHDRRWGKFKASELRRRKQSPQDEINQLYDAGRDVRRSEIQDSSIKQSRPDNGGNEEYESDIDKDESEFNWSR